VAQCFATALVQAGSQIPAIGTFGHLVHIATLPGVLAYNHPTAAPPSASPHQPDPAPPHLSVVPLPSPRTIQHTTAVRRGAPWPAKRPRLPAVREAGSRRQVAFRASLLGWRAPEAPSTGTRLEHSSLRSLGVVAQEVRMRPCRRHPVRIVGQRPASSVRCDQCPVRPVSTLACPATGVRCPVRASERSGVRWPASRVRCPVWASGIRAFLRPLCRAAARSGSAAMAGRRTVEMVGVGVVARCVHDRLVVCPSRSLALEAGAGRAGPAEVSAWTWPCRGEVVGSGQLDRMAD